MKKTLLIAFLILMLTGCGVSTTTTLPSERTTTTTTGLPNGLAPLSAAEDCDIPTLEGGWVCIWADEFSGSAVDETKWNFEVNGDGGGNQELQYYRRENATVADGFLSITAKSEQYLGKYYTSSRITTKYKGTFQYVRIQVRAQMPTGRGTWPAIWMMPLMSAYGGWPNSGEIDIMEYVGYDPDVIHTTIHTEKFNHSIGTSIGFSKTIENAETEYHVYELLWEPGHMEGLVDGVKFAEFNYVAALTKDIPYYEAFPFDQSFFLILNLAVGGTWGGSQGVDTTIFPTSLGVDYVRVYKQDYATLDTEAPTAPIDLEPCTLKNSIFWKTSTDDYGVEKYYVFVNGEFYDSANLNQITFEGLDDGVTYDIQIRAVDFVGRVSDPSPILSYTYHD